MPNLTLGNAVLCRKFDAQASLEVKQDGVGRLALGVHAQTPNQVAQGEMVII